MQPTAPQFTNAYQPESDILQFTFEWTPIEGAYYRLYRNAVLVYDGIGSTAQGDDQIQPGNQYIYSVTAVVDSVESAHSLPVILTPNMTGKPYADTAQLAAFWRPLTDAENSRATTLLDLASNRLRGLGVDVGVDVDAKAAASSVYRSNATWVVMEAVKRAMLMPADAAPANSVQKMAGPYSENIVFTNPAGDLWFKNTELKALGLVGIQSLGSISSTPNYDIYGS